jgi:RNA polymerase sigma factor (sigma-70 family)
MTRDVELAADLAQDALVAALEQWPVTGVPDNPTAWLMTTARRRGIDHFRRTESLRHKLTELERAQGREEADVPDLESQVDHIDDDVLRLVFLSCHPSLTPESRAALTLRLVGGLTTAEIARGFLTSESTMGQRISRAKRTLATEGVDLELPTGEERTRRLDDVMAVIYLIFNEGYTATAGQDWMRTDEQGVPVLLELQDRTQWDELMIRRGIAALRRAEAIAARGVPVGTYFLQASIAEQHALAARAEDTDWHRIAALYDVLAAAAPGPVVEVNRAVAHGRAHGADAGLAVLDRVDTTALGGSPLAASVRGDLLERAGRHAEAAAAFAEAASRTRNEGERTVLGRRAADNRDRTEP